MQAKMLGTAASDAEREIETAKPFAGPQQFAQAAQSFNALQPVELQHRTMQAAARHRDGLGARRRTAEINADQITVHK